MPKTGRNDPCPCGSGKKYKRCCLAKDAATEQASLAATRAGLAAQQAAQRSRIEDFYGSMHQAQALEQASNAVVDLIRAGKLDEAERAARELLVRYPEVHDGHDRLGMLYEARGQPREAADCYRKVLDIVRARPEDYDPAIEAQFLELVAQLDPPASGG